jgi:hypothetical protein
MGRLQVIKSSNGDGIVRVGTGSGSNTSVGSGVVAILGGFVKELTGRRSKVSVSPNTYFAFNEAGDKMKSAVRKGQPWGPSAMPLSRSRSWLPDIRELAG